MEKQEEEGVESLHVLLNLVVVEEEEEKVEISLLVLPHLDV
jgi:hypothetical protein